VELTHHNAATESIAKAMPYSGDRCMSLLNRVHERGLFINCKKVKKRRKSEEVETIRRDIGRSQLTSQCDRERILKRVFRKAKNIFCLQTATLYLLFQETVAFSRISKPTDIVLGRMSGSIT